MSLGRGGWMSSGRYLGLLMRRLRWEEGRGEWAVGDDEGLGQNAQVRFFVLPFLFLFFEAD